MTKITPPMAANDSKLQLSRKTDNDNLRDNWLRQMESVRLAEMNQAHLATNSRGAATRPVHAAATTQASTAAQARTITLASMNTAPYRQGPELAATRVKENPPRSGAFIQQGSQPSTQFLTSGQIQSFPAIPDTQAQQITPPPSSVPRLPCPAVMPAKIDDRAAAAVRPDSAGNTCQLTKAPIWQKRLMRLEGNGNDVNIWIRDAQLGQRQTENLVYRLAGDIATMGLRLNTATVNGKSAFRGTGLRTRSDDTIQFTVTNMREDHGTR